MKRSEINKALRELEAMCEKYHCYLPHMGRFPAIEEDEAPYRLLCNEYPVAK